MRDLEYDSSSSSDEELPKTPSLCQTSTCGNEFTISAKSTTDYVIRLEQGSFVFKRENSNVIIQFNRMFLWRLLNSPISKDEIDLSRLRDFVTRIKDPLVLINVIDGHIKFNFNGQEKRIQYDADKQTKINDNFDQLYYTVMRKYDAANLLDNILTTSIQLLNLIREHF